MPTASEAAPTSWENMQDAWAYLKLMGWTEKVGFLRAPPGKTHKYISAKEYSAVDYLCDEWDWAFYGVKS